MLSQDSANMQRRDFLKAAAATSLITLWNGHTEAGISDHYDRLATQRYLGELDQQPGVGLRFQ
jgi:hypothetical protein